MPTEPGWKSEAHQQLLRAILASPQFANAESLRRILQYLFDRAMQGETAGVKEYDIAVTALRRPDSFDPKADPIVRVSMGGIRERLRSFFENEGSNQDLRLEIPKGQYRAVFHEGALEEKRPRKDDARTRFWAPYLKPPAANTLVYTELLFFRDDSGDYVRNIYVNDLSRAGAALKEHIPQLDTSNWKPSYHFVSAGEMHCLLALTSSFHELGAPLDVRNSRFFAWNELRHSNLILIGSARTNTMVNSLQGDEPFVITDECIVNSRPLEGEEATYRGHRFQEGKLERLVEYAIITRRHGLVGSSVITMVSANHGRAIEGAGQYLSREDKLRELLGKMNVQEAPAHFQALLRVDMIDFDEEVVNVEYVTHRVVQV